MKRIRRIVISQQRGGVKFAEQQGKGDRYISVTNNTLSKMLETEGVEAVETEILREVFEGDIVFNGNHESLTVFRKAWTEWRDFYFNSDKSVEVLHEILRSIHNEIEESQTSCIKCLRGYYAGFYSVNGKLYMYSTEEMPDVNVVYYKSAVSAKKVLRLLEQCENYDQYKPRIVIKSNKETTEGLEELAKWCEEKKVPLEFEGFEGNAIEVCGRQYRKARYVKACEPRLRDGEYASEADARNSVGGMFEGFEGNAIEVCGRQYRKARYVKACEPRLRDGEYASEADARNSVGGIYEAQTVKEFEGNCGQKVYKVTSKLRTGLTQEEKINWKDKTPEKIGSKWVIILNLPAEPISEEKYSEAIKEYFNEKGTQAEPKYYVSRVVLLEDKVRVWISF